MLLTITLYGVIVVGIVVVGIEVVDKLPCTSYHEFE